MFARGTLTALLALMLLDFGHWTAAEEPAATPGKAASGSSWKSLFDGKSLEGWEAITGDYPYKRAGKVRVDDGRVILEKGEPGTGIRYQGQPPRMNYELELEASRLAGNDFFCGLTFPIGESPCTLIVGGWGGGVVGLSNVDGRSADENETMQFLTFKQDQWYKIRLRVTEKRIEVFLDDKRLTSISTGDHKYTIWSEQDDAKPLGITTWYTTSALRNIKLRTFTAEDLTWEPLFDGESLKGWKVSEFGSAGEVKAEEGRIVIGFTDGCNGVTYTGEFPRENYEIRLEAQRVDGSDFFCGMTFPVGKDPCSLIVGGWGGTTVGLSSLDGLDAARNETRKLVSLKTGQWYRIRLRVAGGKIQAWIDDERLIDIKTEGRKISIRPEVDKSKPLGICSWCTTAALRGIQWRKVDAAEE